MKYFWEYPITADTRAHANRKPPVGPATDYKTPMGTRVHAPFLGKLTRGYSAARGNFVKIVGLRYTTYICHLDRFAGRPGYVGWRSLVAYSGNTGQSTGPHVHTWIEIKRTGQRISFSSWLRNYAYKGRPSKLPYNTRKFLGLR